LTTQYAIDITLFGASKSVKNFGAIQALFSTDFQRKNLKAKLTRIVFTLAGPISYNGTTYKDIWDRPGE